MWVSGNMHRALVVASGILLATCGALTAGSSCVPGPLGLLAGGLQEWQLSASSTRMPECQLRFSRVLELPSKGAWCPARDADTEWIQVDLGADARVTGLLTQGRGDGREWVSSFSVSYSMDAFHWKHCLDANGHRKVRPVFPHLSSHSQ
ncbi:hypothetical protein ISCGN_031704 [Ixodes scapularis]